MNKKDVCIVSQFHCDVVWRRPPKEQVAIRQRQYDSALDMLKTCPEFRFEFDQAALVREYLKANPKRLKQMQRFVKEDRIDITGGEEAIPDTNLITGEALVRNIFLGRLWFEEALGIKPVVANMDDAFGLNAQLPQIFVKFGYKYFRDARTPGLDPEVARKGIRWQGLDGSRIFYVAKHGGIQTHTHVCNLPIVYTSEERALRTLLDAIENPNDTVFWGYSSEEDLVTDDIVQMVLNITTPENTRVRFAHCREVLSALSKNKSKRPLVNGELNPTFSGCYTTRIQLKQAYRLAESAVSRAETIATCANLTGFVYPQKRLVEMWRDLSYVQFHDSICGCHTDEVNRKVMRYCRDIVKNAGRIEKESLGSMISSTGKQRSIIAFNPLPVARQEVLEITLPSGKVPVSCDGKRLPSEKDGKKTRVIASLPPMGAVKLKLIPKKSPEVKTKKALKKEERFIVGQYRVCASDRRVKISHMKWKRTIIDGSFPEIRFRHEDGTLWDERLLGKVFRENSGSSKLVSIKQGKVSVRLIWKGTIIGNKKANPLPPCWKAEKNGKPVVYSDLKKLKWCKELVFYHDLERIDAKIHLDFRGRNTEVFAAFPLKIDLKSSHTLYSIPFGAIERRPYYEIPVASPETKNAPTHLAAIGGKGNWPALSWVAYQDKRWGAVLANRGTPGHRLMDGVIETALLRSPTTMASGFNVPSSAHENGHHDYSFSLLPYKGTWHESKAYLAGANFNSIPLTRLASSISETIPDSFLELTPKNVSFSAFKKAERGKGYILRTYETEGKRVTGTLRIPFKIVRCHETDLMEKPLKVVSPGKLTWKPWEIKTLIIDLESAEE